MYLRWFWARRLLLLTRQKQSHDERMPHHEDLHDHRGHGNDDVRAGGRAQIILLQVFRH